MMYVLIGLLLIIGIMLYRTVQFKPAENEAVKLEHIDIDEKTVLSNFSKLLQLKTVSDYDVEKIDQSEFKAFQEILETLYPNIKEACEREFIGMTGVVYKWKGKNTGSESVLMSHYDVVPADEAFWSVDPFGGVVKDGYIWGRGTLDTKISLLSIMESAEKLIKDGFQPMHDIYFSFTGDEEVSGSTTPTIVETFEKRGITPALVVDEGGVVVDNMFPGVAKKVALIGTGEKGYLDLLISGKSAGGHASAPPSKTLTGQLAKAITDIEKYNFKSTFTQPVRDLFNRVGRHSTFTYRFIFSNMWCFMPLLKVLFKKQGGQMNALIRTTMAVTKMEGSKAFNVLPAEASIGLNCRILETTTGDRLFAQIQEIIGNSNFSYKRYEWRNASPITPTDTKEFKLMEELISGIWPEAIVSPYLMIAGTDSRHFNKIAKNVMRFSPMDITSEELSRIHSNDERVRTETVSKSVQFYLQLINRL